MAARARTVVYGRLTATTKGVQVYGALGMLPAFSLKDRRSSGWVVIDIVCLPSYSGAGAFCLAGSNGTFTTASSFAAGGMFFREVVLDDYYLYRGRTFTPTFDIVLGGGMYLRWVGVRDDYFENPYPLTVDVIVNLEKTKVSEQDYSWLSGGNTLIRPRSSRGTYGA